jgi:uncharacterized protein DUF3107
MVSIRVGITDSAKELSVDLDESMDKLIGKIDSAVGAGKGILWLDDRKGKKVGVPVTKLAYIEVEPETSAHAVGFSAR